MTAVDGLDRYKTINHFNYTEADLAEKKLALHNLKIMYPDVSPYYAGLIYDMCKNSTPEQIEEMKKKADAPFKYNYSGLQEILDEVKNKNKLNENKNENEILE